MSGTSSMTCAWNRAEGLALPWQPRVEQAMRVELAMRLEQVVRPDRAMRPAQVVRPDRAMRQAQPGLLTPGRRRILQTPVRHHQASQHQRRRHRSPTKSKSLVFRRGSQNCRRISLVYTLNEEPHPQVLFTFGFSNLKPEASRVSTKTTTQPFRYMAEVASTYTFRSSKL